MDDAIAYTSAWASKAVSAVGAGTVSALSSQTCFAPRSMAARIPAFAPPA